MFQLIGFFNEKCISYGECIWHLNQLLFKLFQNCPVSFQQKLDKFSTKYFAARVWPNEKKKSESQFDKGVMFVFCHLDVVLLGDVWLVLKNTFSQQRDHFGHKFDATFSVGDAPKSGSQKLFVTSYISYIPYVIAIPRVIVNNDLKQSTIFRSLEFLERASCELCTRTLIFTNTISL